MILMAPCIIDFIGANGLLEPVGTNFTTTGNYYKKNLHQELQSSRESLKLSRDNSHLYILSFPF